MLRAYAAERLPLRLLLPVAMLLALPSAAAGWPGLAAMAGHAGMALLLFVQFRLWDDLADRHADRVRHPDRTLCRAASPRPIVWTCLALAVVNQAAAFARGSMAFWTLAGLTLSLGALYRLRGRRSALADYVLLAKYPAIVLVLAGPRTAAAPVAMAGAMATVYLAACVYEAWHDPAGPLAADFTGGRP
jgi:4-hydroxybenzoate polyprenyltransferase